MGRSDDRSEKVAAVIQLLSSALVLLGEIRDVEPWLVSDIEDVLAQLRGES